ncbi:MAG: hypothetical protein RLZZ127_848, partial [Planctomycetota bacterium]
MLNAILVEMLIAAHRTRRTGMLVLEGLSLARGVGFINGDLVALDLAQAQDRLLADKLLEHHKIGPELHRLVSDAQSGDPVAFLRRQQAVSDGEIEAVRQALVEDALVQLLASPGQPEFIDEHPDSLHYASSAIRLRIDPQVLVRTAGARAGEDAAVAKEVGGWDAVFALTENTSGSGSLNDLERQVLNLVDGRRSVDELAITMRESCPQVARVLRGLLQKQIVRKVPGQSTRSFRNAVPVAEPDLVITTVSAPRRRSPAVLVGLVALLIVLGGVGYLVVDYGGRAQALAQRLGAVDDAIRTRDWNQAAASLAEATAQAGTDLSAMRRVQGARQSYEKALDEERRRIADMIQARTFATAQDAAAALPDDPDRADLTARIARSAAEFQRLSDGIQAAVSAHLSREDLAAALAEVEAHPSPEHDAGAALLDRRRTVLIESARTANEPIARRRLLLQAVLAAGPSEAQRAAAAQAEREIALAVTQAANAIAGLDAMVRAGRLADLRETLSRTGLADRVAGSELAADLERVLAVVEAADRDVMAAAALADAAVAGDPAASASLAAQRVRDLAARYPSHPRLAAIQGTAALAAELELAAAALPIADEIPLLRTRATQPGAPVAAIENRMARLNDRERAAQAQLDAALVHRRDGDLEEAAAQLIDLIDSPFARRTTAVVEAAQRLAEVREAQERRRQLADRLDAAVQAGDAATALAIARDMGLRHLPVKVESVPSGATVSIGARELGRTPLILNLSALERSESDFVFTLPEYEQATIKGSDAENGWRVAAVLRRRPALTLDLDRPLTARPAAVGTAAVVASRTAALVIPAGAGVAPAPVALEQGGSLDVAPLLAPAAAVADGIWFASPDAVAWRLDGTRVRRVVLPAGTRLALAGGASELLPDRRWLVVAGDDGRLHGVDDDGRAAWASQPGAAFVAAPSATRGKVTAVRRDGRITILAIEDGRSEGQVPVPAPVVAAWPIPGGWAGISAAAAWSWTGGEVRSEALPVDEAVAAGDGVVVGPGNRVWIRTDAWTEVGT